MENVKRKIISFWLAHFFIRRIAKRYPDFFKKWVCDITDNRLERKTVIFRYHGYYIVPTTGTPYVILVDTPCDLAYAVSSAAVVVATTDETEGD